MVNEPVLSSHPPLNNRNQEIQGVPLSPKLLDGTLQNLLIPHELRPLVESELSFTSRLFQNLVQLIVKYGKGNSAARQGDVEALRQ